MTYQYDDYNWLVRLEKGELLMENLMKLIELEQIKGAWISGLGGALWAELGFYHLDTKEYSWKKLDKNLEITSLQGNIAWDGEEPVVHLHGTLSDENMQAYGGHIKELAVAGTCEMLIHRWNKEDKLERKQSGEIGLKLLEL